MLLNFLDNLSNSRLAKKSPIFKAKIDGFVDWYCQKMEYAGPRKFEERYQSITLLSIKQENTRNFIETFPDSHGKKPDEADLINFILSKASEEHPARLSINHSPFRNLTIDLSKENAQNNFFHKRDLHTPDFNTLSIETNFNSLTLRAITIDSLFIRCHPEKLIIDNCNIGEIRFGGSLLDSYKPGTAKIQNTWISKIYTDPKGIGTLSIKGGWICSFICSPTYGENPFMGEIEFSGTKFPTSGKRSLIFHGPQQYRNLRAHFESLQNGPMAGLMRAKELTAERETDTGVSWFFNWIYCIASGYGRRPGRAFLWFLGILALNVCVLTATDGVIVVPKTLHQGAWQRGWEGEDIFSQAIRSTILTFQTAINPFTIFLAKSAFKFKSLFATIHTFFLVLLADSAFIFGSFAIRKRLKFS